MEPSETTNRQPGVTPPSFSGEQPGPEEANPSLREWFARNGSGLVFLTGLLVILYGYLVFYLQYSGEDVWDFTLVAAKVGIGLGFVIFIHELGHFAVAKWCDVHVETFSIGFGPALPGCKFKHGETTYMIGLIPLGGYVKMVGEGAETEEGDSDPRSFKNKSVWQRMAIISAGVTMNVILAFLCFIVVFRGPGKKQEAGVVGQVVAGSPAWEQKIPGGACVVEIGSKKAPIYFLATLLPEVMLNHGKPLPLAYSFPPHMKGRREVTIEPRQDKTGGRQVIGVLPAESLQVVKRPKGTTWEHPASPKSAADRATPGFEFGDIIVGCTDPDHPEQDWSYLRKDERNDQKEQRDYFDFAERLVQLADQPITIRVERMVKGNVQEVSLQVPRAFHSDFGFLMEMGQITAVRRPAQDTDWGKNKPIPADTDAKRSGDVIEQVEVPERGGGVTRFLFPSSEAVFPVPQLLAWPDGKELDPMRLRFELQKWAARVPDKFRFVTLKVRRQNTQKTLKLPWSEIDKDNNIPWKFAREVPLTADDPTSIPELGICFQVNTTVAGVEVGKIHYHKRSMPGGIDKILFGDPVLKKGDVIQKIRFWAIDEKGEEKPHELELKEPGQWAHVFWSYQHYGYLPRVELIVTTSDESVKIIFLDTSEDPSWPLAERGLYFKADQRIQRADSIGEAIVMGLDDTWSKITQIVNTMRSIFSGRVSVKNLGGPVTIARVAYNFAGENLWEYVYFLGLISINLAVVNFFPIPVLDGGHMVFLIYEKIRGKPASEQVRSVATIVGLVLILSLMVFVLFLDFSKIFGK